MAGTVDLPVIGKVKSGWVWAGGGVVLLIVGFAYVRNRGSAASASTTAAAGSTTTDPATGYPEGSAEDIAALQDQGGAYAGVGGYSGAGGGITNQQYYYDPADGLYDLTAPYTGNGAGTANTGPGTFSSNAYWVQYCEQNVVGYSASQIQGALSAYLAGIGLSTTQFTIYQAALAVGGEPPEPPSKPAHLATTTSGGGSSSTAKVAVPNVVGQPQEAAYAILAAAGLHASGAAPVKGKTRTVTAQDPKAKTEAAKGTTVKLTSKLS